MRRGVVWRILLVKQSGGVNLLTKMRQKMAKARVVRARDEGYQHECGLCPQ